MEGEYFYLCRKNWERVEYYLNCLSINERLEEWFDKGRIVKVVCDSGCELRIIYEFEYYLFGELKILMIILRIGWKFFKKFFLEYEFD